MKFEALIEGYNATISELDLTRDEIELDIDHAIQMAGMRAEKDAWDMVPVRTGELQDSITFLPGYLKSEVFTDVYYSIFVELGTIKMSDQPFMIPAFEYAKSMLLLDIQDI